MMPDRSEIQKPRLGKPWPLFRSLQGWHFSYLNRDWIAGLTLAAVAIPEQMATARLAGFTPLVGLFAFVAGTLAFAALGSNRQLSAGADSTIAPIFAAGLAIMAEFGSNDYQNLAAALALMVGIILICAGLFRLGWIADLLSIPVRTGFLAGIAVHIIVSQLPSLIGSPIVGGDMLSHMANIPASIARMNPYTSMIGLGVLAIALSLEKLSVRIPGALIGVIAATLAVFLFHLELRGVTVLGDLHTSWPHFTIPDISFAAITQMSGLAIVIATIIMLQTAATSRSFPSDTNEIPDVSRDYIGMGAGCIFAGFLGAFPINASPPRSAAVAEANGQSQLTGIVAVLAIVGLLCVGGTIMARIPVAAMAGILFYIALRIIRIPIFAIVYRQTRAEFALIVSTMLAIAILPIQSGVAIGIFLSLLHGIWSTTRARIIELERVPGTSIWWVPGQLTGERHDHVMVLAFQAPISFLNAYEFRSGILDAISNSSRSIKLLVLEANGIIGLDFTASKILSDTIEQCRSAGLDFAIARLESVRAQEAFARFKLSDQIGLDHMFRSVEQAIEMLAPPQAASRS